MDVMVKMARFQIKQNVLNLKSTLGLKYVPKLQNLECQTFYVNWVSEPCVTNEGNSPEWKDYLVISPLWNFKRSWLYCGHATKVRNVKNTSLCHKMAVSFRSNNNHNCMKGFFCTYRVI